MNIGPSALPERCNVADDDLTEMRVDEILQDIASKMAAVKNTGGTCHVVPYNCSFHNVGTALIFTCAISKVNHAEQWVLRQRLLSADWDEVEFDYLSNTREQTIALIQHRWSTEPRRVVVDPYKYRHIDP